MYLLRQGETRQDWSWNCNRDMNIYSKITRNPNVHIINETNCVQQIPKSDWTKLDFLLTDLTNIEKLTLGIWTAVMQKRGKNNLYTICSSYILLIKWNFQPTNFFSVFDHFLGLALKGLSNDYKQIFALLVKTLSTLFASYKHFLQMDKWKVVSGHADGTICLWDSKSGVKYWQTYMKHPVRICHFNESLLTYINIPEDTSPQNSCWNADDLIQQRKYRGKTISFFVKFLKRFPQSRNESNRCLFSYLKFVWKWI